MRMIDPGRIILTAAVYALIVLVGIAAFNQLFISIGLVWAFLLLFLFFWFILTTSPHIRQIADMIFPDYKS